MSKVTFVLILVSFFVGYGSFAVASSGDSKESKGVVSFLAIGRPAMLKIKGESQELMGHLQFEGKTVSGKFEIPISRFSTGIEMRDEHMKAKYLEVAKYPKSELALNPLMLKEQEGLPFAGVLQLHGISKPVEGLCDVKLENSVYHVTAKLKISLSDFQIDIPSYAGIKIADTVEIQVATSAPGSVP